MPEKLVENKDLATGADDAGDFAEAALRLGNNGQDQMQDGTVETGVGEGQCMHVALYGQEVEMAGAWQGTTQHRPVEVDPDVMMLWWQVRQIKAGTNAGQQNPAAGTGQTGQAVPAGRPRRPIYRRVVKGGDQRITVFEAQCSTLGMASVNSGISASKWVPSSATIW